jgi:ABC-2 type transport system permease protein
MIGLRKYSWVGYISARANLAYFGEVAARIIFLGVILFIFLRLWTVTYSETGSAVLGGFTLAQMLWYLAMTEAMVLSSPRVSEAVDEDVRTGAIAVQLLRPLYYPAYRLWTTLGERFIRFLLNAAVGAGIVLFFVGPIPFTIQGLAMFAVSLPLAFTLDFLGYFLVGIAAFWMEDTSGLRLIYSRLIMIVGGMLIPLELFPPVAQPVLQLLPFASILYTPARLFVNPDLSYFMQAIPLQVAWVAMLTGAVIAIYRIAVQKIQGNGG